MNSSSPLLVVLDLDETLFHSRDEPLDHPADFRIEEYHTYKRPGVDAFLQKLINDPRFSLAVWTSATEDYATTALEALGIHKDTLLACFSRERCVRTSLLPEMGFGEGERLVKDLRKLQRVTGWPVERMIAIDDNADFFTRQYSNLLRVEPYYGGEEMQKDVFVALLDRLTWLHTQDNVRPHEKRKWYAEYQARQKAAASSVELL
jgi:RNA polymerase II subunit A small phosphatase-like protein